MTGDGGKDDGEDRANDPRPRRVAPIAPPQVSIVAPPIPIGKKSAPRMPAANGAPPPRRPIEPPAARRATDQGIPAVAEPVPPPGQDEPGKGHGKPPGPSIRRTASAQGMPAPPLEALRAATPGARRHPRSLRGRLSERAALAHPLRRHRGDRHGVARGPAQVARTHGDGLGRQALEAFYSRNQARRELVDYIEGFYNCWRRHSSIGYVSPAAFEEQVA